MNFLPHKKVILFTLLIVSFLHNSYSQDEQNKWIIGVGMNAVDFFPTGEPSEFTGNNGGFFSGITNAKDHWNVSAPTVNVTRYLKNRFSVDASISMNNITKVGDFKTQNTSYFAIDATAQYDILKNTEKFKPYVFAGGGYTWVDSKGWGLVDVGLGTNYWFSKKFGVRVQGAYKHSGDKKHRVLSHFQYTFGLVMKLNTNSKFICN